MLRKVLFSIILCSQALSTYTGIIEDTVECALPALGKTVYIYGEEHTDPFDKEAVAQRDELADSINTLIDTHQEPMSCYLECDTNLQKDLRQSTYFYLRDLSTKGAFFEQWYVPLARSYGKEVKHGSLYLSSFDIRDNQYLDFECALRMFADERITRDDIDFDDLEIWAKTVVDPTIDGLFIKMQKLYPKKMISYVQRDMQRKKKKFSRMLDAARTQKRARFSDRALEDFYNYTDLLADFTILNKVANDPREAIIIHAGSAHMRNISSYFNHL